MAWLKGDDKANGNPKLRAVAQASRTGGWGVLFSWLYAAQQGTDGWLPQWVVDREFTEKELTAVTTIKANGRAPLLHKFDPDVPDEDLCSCLHDKKWTAEMGGYWIHDWLNHNPSKAENTVHRAKGTELKDQDLILLIRQRDGNACRYCLTVVPWADRKSPRMLTIDHVDPTLAAGADNLVVACMFCNSKKKDARTPAAAGLTLHGPPVDVPTNPGVFPPVGWPKGTDPFSIERHTPWPQPGAEPAETTDRITTGSPDPSPDPDLIGPDSDHRSDPDPTSDPQPGDSPVENRAHQREQTSRASPGTTTDGLPPQRGRAGGGSRSPQVPHAGDVGPAGRRPVIGPATTPRSAANPPTYRKSATSNPPPEEEGPP
ncbi:HNH endonuclease signature motif containing protein [Saccharothrix texasensis]|uniref:5-methylcytosine-specific restriction endonuclease McrA n=1 Tax=Saccharothrix texasensis TaxID=103734 RepID=A0A3N1H165_9PSEU|nr:HNH endonuclease signature motif containing protein [Saccharothrix texasensis]ROP36267.1 5-methylcytosine-specific restriction endonuclease McrA [Saccharothrix texasensis]